jgi:4-hydroxy-2-oxoheptanedioate aldolase
MLPDLRLASRIRCGAVTTDLVRARWFAGEEPALAAWLLLESPIAAELLGGAGFDAVVVDLQHGSATLDGLPHVARAIDATPAVPFARTAANDPAELMRVLDLGVPGVICPMIGSREEADAFVRACRYPPDGVRSYGPIRAAHGAGRDHTSRANADVILFAMIETAEGLANVEEIAATPGLDGLFVGPTDLGLSLGLDRPGDLTDRDLRIPIESVLAAAQDANRIAAIHAPDPMRAADMAARGFRLISCAVDTELMREAAVAALRTVRGSG